MKRHEQQELSYYGLYLLRYLLEQHSRKAKDLGFIYQRELNAAEAFEQARLDGHSVEGAQELAMAELMKGLSLTMASNEWPCLLLKPLMIPVLPSVSNAFNWSLVSSLPAFSRNTWQSQAGLSHFTTFL